jgi:hypothetical protein
MPGRLAIARALGCAALAGCAQAATEGGAGDPADAAAQIDGACAQTFHRDADGDGHGTAETMLACPPAPEGWVAVADDCDDGDPLRHPGLDELCDGVDSDCAPDTPDVCPAQCQVRLRDARIYLFCNADTTGDAAAAVCASQAMRAVRIDDADENEYVRLTAQTAFGVAEPLIAGGRDSAAEGTWAWADGEPFYQGGAPVEGRYTNWLPGQPDNFDGVEHCLELQPEGRWNDVACSVSAEFVCERY